LLLLLLLLWNLKLVVLFLLLLLLLLFLLLLLLLWSLSLVLVSARKAQKTRSPQLCKLPTPAARRSEDDEVANDVKKVMRSAVIYVLE